MSDTPEQFDYSSCAYNIAFFSSSQNNALDGYFLLLIEFSEIELSKYNQHEVHNRNALHTLFPACLSSYTIFNRICVQSVWYFVGLLGSPITLWIWLSQSEREKQKCAGGGVCVQKSVNKSKTSGVMLLVHDRTEIPRLFLENTSPVVSVYLPHVWLTSVTN